MIRDEPHGLRSHKRVERMVERVERLSPRIPLRFGAIAELHHANGGAEIFPNEIRISLRLGHITSGSALPPLQH